MENINIPIPDEKARTLLSTTKQQIMLKLDKSERNFGWYKCLLYLAANYCENNITQFDVQQQKILKEVIKSLRDTDKLDKE